MTAETLAVADSDKTREKKILDDTRSTERIHADTLIDLIRLGANADP